MEMNGDDIDNPGLQSGYNPLMGDASLSIPSCVRL